MTLGATANDADWHEMVKYVIPNATWYKDPLGYTVKLKMGAKGWAYDAAPGAQANTFSPFYHSFKEQKGHAWLNDEHYVDFIPSRSAAMNWGGDLWAPVNGPSNVRANATCKEHLTFDAASMNWLHGRIAAFLGVLAPAA